jgi:hypothetical protein
MENNDLKSMAIDELWQLYEKVARKLAREMGDGKGPTSGAVAQD